MSSRGQFKPSVQGTTVFWTKVVQISLRPDADEESASRGSKWPARAQGTVYCFWYQSVKHFWRKHFSFWTGSQNECKAKKKKKLFCKFLINVYIYWCLHLHLWDSFLLLALAAIFSGTEDEGKTNIFSCHRNRVWGGIFQGQLSKWVLFSLFEEISSVLWIKVNLPDVDRKKDMTRIWTTPYYL